jgi:hypothetical protein
MMGMARPIAKEPWEAPATLAAARELARRHCEEAIPILVSQFREAKDHRERGLALAVLAVLADRPAGAEALASLLFEFRSLHEQAMAFSLLADLHGPASRPFLECLVSDACRRLRAKPPEPEGYRIRTTLSQAGEFLSAVGDERSSILLREELDRGGKVDPAAVYLRASLDGLESRLALPPGARAAWSRDAIEFSKAQLRFSQDISARNGAYRGAGLLTHRGVRLSVPFLHFKLAGTAWDMAIAVAGDQREAQLVPDLVRICRSQSGYCAGMALSALGQIGGRKALDGLLGLVRPGLPMRVAAPLSILATRGDAETLRTLDLLACDRSLDALDRADVRIAREYLAARLAGNVPASLMGDGPQFPIR